MSDDEDDYITYGKPLKELEEGDKIRKRPIAVEEQIALDKHGKRRFHGAFQGGFSAGFFNTVDTPQGWTPAQFKSSRDKNRGVDKDIAATTADGGDNRMDQRPEDFMDDEDFGSFGFAPHALKTKSRFQNNSSQEVTRSTRPDNTLLGPVINNLIQPTKPTIGESLLRKQGWKPGQGIGPKTCNRSKKDRKSSHKNTYGEGTSKRGRHDSDDSDQEMFEKYKEFMFAPDELPIYMANPKDNLFGIGYKGLDRPQPGGARLQESGGFSVKSGVNKKKFSMSGEAFGVGVYEEDDYDVYNKHSDMGQYDFSLDVRGDQDNSSNTSSSKKSNSAMLDQLTNVLEGFTLSTKKSMLMKSFPAPRLPRDWRHSTTGYVKKSRFDEGTRTRDSSRATGEPVKPPGGSNPTRDQRRSTLFPDQRDSSRSSSRKEKEDTLGKDLKRYRDGTGDVKAEDIKEEVKDENEELPDFLTGWNSTAPEPTSDFKPFKSDPAKQLRYEQFLVCIKNNRRDALRILQPKAMTEWQRERERVEFERAAHLFKPLNVAIASRFVSSGTIKEDGSVEESKAEIGGLNSGNLTQTPAAAAVMLTSKAVSFVKSTGGGDGDVTADKRKAVQMKMFGNLTRETEEWVPAKLLCVRFNVKNPFNNTREHEEKKKKPIFESNQLFAFLEGGRSGEQQSKRKQTSDGDNDHDEKSATGDDNTKKSADGTNNGRAEVKEERITLADVTLVKDEPEITQEKPPMDLFKAIFAGGDDDSDDNSDDANINNTNDDDSPIADNTMKRSRPAADDGGGSSGSSRHDSPADAARGIFAGIDFDKFVKRRRKTPPPVVPLKALTSRPKSILDRSVRNILGIKSGDVSDDEYGPVAPPTVLAANAAASRLASTTSNSPLNSRKRKERDNGKSIVISSGDSESSQDEKKWEEKSKKAKKKKKGKDKEKDKIVISSDSSEGESSDNEEGGKAKKRKKEKEKDKHKKEKKSKKSKRKKKKHKSSRSDSD